MPQEQSSAPWNGLAAALEQNSRYQPLRRLGRNVGRQTLLARDLSTKKKVVVKILGFDEELTWNDVKLFEREAELLRSLSHSSIPQYLDYFELEAPNLRGFALVQSYIEARSLEKYLEAGRTFSEAEIGKIGDEVLRILDYLHHRQPAVIHRDIKPSNILLSNRTAHSVGQVYLVDFGSVQTMVARPGRTVTVVGTYGYMPPEQFGGRAVPASDLYSLGATLIFLASGQHPAELPQDGSRIRFENVVRLSPARVAWLKHLTEPSLEKRVGSVQEAVFHASPVIPQVSSSRRKPSRVNNQPLKPSFSKIEAEYKRGRLVLKIPHNRVSILERGKSNVNSHLIFILCALAFSFIGLMISGDSGMAFFVVTCGLSMVWLAIYLIAQTAESPTLLSMNQQEIDVVRSNSHRGSIQLTEDSSIKRSYSSMKIGPVQASNHVEVCSITLNTETHQIFISAFSHPELFWLDDLLCGATGLPEDDERKYFLRAGY